MVVVTMVFGSEKMDEMGFGAHHGSIGLATASFLEADDREMEPQRPPPTESHSQSSYAEGQDNW